MSKPVQNVLGVCMSKDFDNFSMKPKHKSQNRLATLSTSISLLIFTANRSSSQCWSFYDSQTHWEIVVDLRCTPAAAGIWDDRQQLLFATAQFAASAVVVKADADTKNDVFDYGGKGILH